MLEELALRPLGTLGPTNFLKYAVQLAVESGIPLQTVVVLLLFPLVAFLIAAARHLVGIRGLGVFTPAMLAVVFLLMGVFRGTVLFFLILLIASLARTATRGLKIHYLARMAMIIWFVCLGVFVSLFWLKNNLFPILILILLAENFVEIQISKSLRDATQLTLETLILALGGWGILSWKITQRLTVSQPELVVFGTLILNFLVGRFTGLRLLEYRRFRRLLK